jgi:hypothetical protein
LFHQNYTKPKQNQAKQKQNSTLILLLVISVHSYCKIKKNNGKFIKKCISIEGLEILTALSLV